MGDLRIDTELVAAGRDGETRTYLVELSDDWRIWTLNGGYVAAVVLRAAGLVTELRRPATLSLQLIRGAVAGPADVQVRSVRRARTAECLAISIDQAGQRVAEGHVWAVSDAMVGPTHDDAGPRPGDPPSSYPSMDERIAARGDDVPTGTRIEFPFWENLDVRPIDWVEDWEHRSAGPAVAGDWLRFTPTSTYEDPFLDAGRLAVALDLYSFPSLARGHAAPIEWVAPNIDLHCTFHRPADESPWILGVGRTPSSGAGLAGFTAEAWSESGLLLASGGGQMLVRTVG